MMQQQKHAIGIKQIGIVRVVATTAGSFLILLPLLFLLNMGASAAPAKPMPSTSQVGEPSSVDPFAAAADCMSASIVPPGECLALVAIYTETFGTGWTNRTNWLNFGPIAPCGWYGVVCEDGHVRELLLAGNQLSGTLPLALGKLTQLRRLRLENNALVGRVPPTLCSLANLTDLSLAYNALGTPLRSVAACLTALESDWRATQTTPVSNLRVTEVLTDAIHLEWKPISYTQDGGYYEIGIATEMWGPYTLHGTTTDKLASSYVITGLNPGTTYYVAVRSYTPPHGDQPSPVRSLAAPALGVTKAISGSVLVAVYFPADNNLSTEIPYVIRRMRYGTATNPNVQIVVLVDGRQDDDTVVIDITGGRQPYTTTVIEDVWGVKELDTGDPKVLSWFLRYARTTYPAERTVAAIIGHGVALAPEVEWPEEAAMRAAASNNQPSNRIPPLPKEHDYSPSDVTNRGYMSAVDVGKALMEATDNGANPFDLIFFDQCFQGNLDVLYEVRNSAQVYVASPNYAWLVAAYDRYLTRFTPAATPVQMAQAIINNYESSLNPHHPNAIFWVRNSDLLAIATKINQLADALIAAVQANEHQKIANAVIQSEYADTTQCGERKLQLGPPDELIGLESFAAGLVNQFGTNDPYGIANALSGLHPLMMNVNKHSITGNPYLAPDQLWDFTDSLTILAPLPRDSASNVAWRASIYRSDMPFTATWSVDPTQPVTVTESLAFVRDGRWDEFLQEWYLGLSPTVGQWCQYMPPVQVAVSETESLSLTVNTVTSGSLQLAWTPTDNTTALEYWLYAQNPYDIGLDVERILPLSETTATFAGLDKGDYRFMVVALDDQQLAVAQSNEVSVTISGAITANLLIPLRLPLVLGD